ncbi:bacillithiol biosynthesis cysteine-adding enzyme BshC [Sediminibacillus albus]|uniref:Putative cysteine ligase BshC n=1 Tax=Sediminibacillus albus TaxID=407036 RepID=A0A1G8W7U3_9BACI|nr:bacillithiol biosynthesis cysteine-adding enzyme BshC [Sediminibacillus albus]SDJ74371.1 bacillithiol biosynthesis cysteine-adding enzyme BshC [Sediminibacillus albus]
MRIDPMKLNKQSKLFSGYRSGDELIQNKFDYFPFEQKTYELRALDIKEREYNREGLAAVLHEQNSQWGAPAATNQNIDRLKDENSVVVIGGQQAGLMTGPLYTIHKIISIVNFARQQEEKLNIPVVPVFWIAGEDHDFDEINHIMVKEANRMKKHKIRQKSYQKKSASALQIDQVYAAEWLDRIFEKQVETSHTKTLFNTFKRILESSDTYVDFFARVIFQLFDKQGIVLVDSGSPLLRKLESEHFLSMVENQPAISQGVHQAVKQSQTEGYPIELEAEEDNAHLFYHKNGERILLFRRAGDVWAGKQNECEFTTEELEQIAACHPEQLSNNVVTRPLMQELLFPSLAFIGGPGEISYWSVLKPAFQALDLKMPPVLPRLSFTLAGRTTEKVLQNFSLPVEQVVREGISAVKVNWLASQSSPPIEQLIDQVKYTVEAAHLPLRKAAKDIRADLGEVAEKNLFYLFQDLSYLEDRMTKAVEEKYAKTIHAFDNLEIVLHPEGGLQERNWNIIPWINEYGIDFINQLVEGSYDYQEEHYIAFL